MKDFIKTTFTLGLAMAFLTVAICLLVERRRRIDDMNKAVNMRRLENVALYNDSRLYVFELDGHEYMCVMDSHIGGLCHKADCRFCMEDKDEK